jgi:hypothetical protein
MTTPRSTRFQPGRPQAAEHSDFHARYIDMVPEADLLSAMHAQTELTRAAFLAHAEHPGHTYAPGKWTVLQMLGHMTDTERVFGSRLLFFARRDPATLPGIEQDDWMAASDFSSYTLSELLSEFASVRAGHLSLLSHLRPEAWEHRGTASGNGFTVRALAYMLLGHERAHLEILKERY